MPQASKLTRTAPRCLELSWTAAVLLIAGLLLRVFFLRRHAFLAGDSILYQDIAQNWLHAHVYGLSTDTDPRPTLIRLPGYPAILAVFAWLFDRVLNADLGTLHSFVPVLWLQIVADLATCWLVAHTAFRMLGRRAAMATLALACLCPFTANYTAVPLTETFTLFFLALTFLLLQRWLELPSTARLAALAAALSCGVLLRPDEGLLALAVVPVLFFGLPTRSSVVDRLKPVVLCMTLAAVPFVPWTVRNLHTFHVFQPLASRLANDPGEIPADGFHHWYRTWAVDFTSTLDAYWKYPEEPVRVADLPVRAFDSPAERTLVTTLLQQTATTRTLDPAVEGQFEALALQRTHAHPFRTHVEMPVARVVNMLLHPRTEMLPGASRWWQYRLHPGSTLFALFFAALNFAYFAAAAIGFRRARRTQPAIALAMAGYILLRCALLLTLDNAEQRYTLEFFPILFVFAGALWARHEPQPQVEPASRSF